MERRGFFTHLVGQLAQAMSGGYVVAVGKRQITFYEGVDKPLPLWLAPGSTGAFEAVCHVVPQALNAREQAVLAEKTACVFTKTVASDVGQKAEAYVLFSPKLDKLPQAPALVLFHPKEAQKLAAKLPEVMKKMPAGSDIFVGSLDDWQNSGSPVHGRIQLFISAVK